MELQHSSIVVVILRDDFIHNYSHFHRQKTRCREIPLQYHLREQSGKYHKLYVLNVACRLQKKKKTTTEDVNSPESLWSVFSLHSSFSAASSVENKKTWSIQNVSNCSFYTEEHEDQERTNKTMFGTTPINHGEINSEKWRYYSCRWLYSDWIWSHRLGTVVSAATWQPINMEAGWSRKWGQSRRLPKTKQSVSEAYATSCLPDPSVSTQAEYSQKKRERKKKQWGWRERTITELSGFRVLPSAGGREWRRRERKHKTPAVVHLPSCSPPARPYLPCYQRYCSPCGRTVMQPGQAKVNK